MNPYRSDFSKLLHEHFLNRKARNPSYSLRAFARQLQVVPSAISEILNGKRNVSREFAIKVANRLYLSAEEMNRLLHSFPGPGPGSKPKLGVIQYTELDVDRCHIAADWIHFALLSLIETDDFKSDPKWMSQRLGVPVAQVTAAVRRLVRLKLVIQDRNGKLSRREGHFSTSDGVPNGYVRKSHYQNLELARRSLDQDELDARDFSAMTMAIDPEDLPKARKLIREFRDKLCLVLEGKKGKKEVYRFSIQLFPLTQKERTR